MELSRRDALAVLTAGGVGVGLGIETQSSHELSPPDQEPGSSSLQADLTTHERETLTNTAHVIYPTIVTGIDRFVNTYLDGRSDTAFVTGASEAISLLDAHSQDWYGDPFTNLSLETQNQVLQEMGAQTADPSPAGSPSEKVRYYLINELLYALYTSPTGGSLIGLDNPQGYPGGIESYQRGPLE